MVRTAWALVLCVAHGLLVREGRTAELVDDLGSVKAEDSGARAQLRAISDNGIAPMFQDPTFRELWREATRGGFVPLDADGSKKRRGLAEQKRQQQRNIDVKPAGEGTLPFHVDWRDQLPDIKFQGPCSVCWAFVATSMVEFGLKQDLSLQEPVSLSEQHLLDCNRLGVNDGCSGGNFYSALDEYTGFFFSEEEHPFIISTADQNTRQSTLSAILDEDIDGFCENEYNPDAPGGKGKIAKLSDPSSVVNDELVVFVEPLTEYELMRAVSIAPVGIAIAGYSDAFLRYNGDGIMDHSSCGDDVDHAALVVGYGTTPQGEDYWLIRNSWSTSWGDDGHIKLRRGAVSGKLPRGPCGMLTQANYLRPGRVECTAPSGNCSDHANSRFCTAELGCQTPDTFRSEFNLGEYLPGLGSSNDGSNDSSASLSGAEIALITASCLMGAGLLGYVVYRRNQKSDAVTKAVEAAKRHFETVKMSPSGGKEKENAVEITPSPLDPLDEAESREKLDQLRARLGKVEAFKRRKERDAVLQMYLDDNQGDVTSALAAYMENEQ